MARMSGLSAAVQGVPGMQVPAARGGVRGLSESDLATGALRVSVAKTSAALQADPGDAMTSSNSRLVTAAHQFEAAMMQELLGPLTKQMQGMDGMTDDEDGGTNQALTSFASEALGEALSERGGFGIASSVLKKLTHAVEKKADGAEGGAKIVGVGHQIRKVTSVGKQNGNFRKTPIE